MNKKSQPKNANVGHSLPARLENEIAHSIKPETPTLNKIFHAVNPGDMIAAMGCIKRFYEVTGRKSIVYQSTTQLAAYYAGAVHPTVNERGENVCCNKPMFDMLKPLIESQEYISSFEEYSGQPYDLDFNVVRGKTFVNLPHGAIQNWVSLAFPDLAFDISKPWMTLPGKCPKYMKDQVQGKIILNFTERYRSGMIDYFFLKNYEPNLVFAGTEKEHYLFASKWNLNIPRLEVKNFLDLAYGIREAKFMMGNQSFNYNIACAIHSPRILEICQYAQNCIHGVGENSYGFFHQVGAEYYFRKLFNVTRNK